MKSDTRYRLGYIASLMMTLFAPLFFPETACATLTNGANAIDLLGQYDQTSFTDPVPVYTKSGANDGPNKFGINFVAWTLVDTTNQRLFVSESTNNRVLVYALNSDGTVVDHVPDNILGQSNYYSSVSSTQQNTLSSPAGMAYDSANNRLFVSDSSHARIMVYDVASITDGENATNVLGQPNFIASVSGPTQNTMSSPEGLSYDSANNRLFVATYGYSRVVLYDVASITNGENATNVLGQTTYTVSSSALTQKGMNTPYGVAYDAPNNRLFVSDSGNNRLLTFDVSSIVDGQNAINVLGAADFTTSNTVTQQNTMYFPVDLAYDSANNRLFVPQFNSTRIAVYDVASITNGENATNVLGQTLFNSSGGGTTQSTISSPIGVSYDSVNQKLFYTDRSNYRLLVFDVNAITNGEPAVDLIGQYDESSYTAPVPVYTKSGSDNGPNRFGFNNARSVAVDSTNFRLFVSDQTNNRVLVYAMNSNGTFVDRVPDNVLGRPNFYTLTAATQQNGMSTPTGLTYDSSNNRLFVAQSGNNRVTVYDVTAITDGENATNVLGQPNFQASTAATQQNGMSSPLGLAYDSGNNRLFVAQSGNNRVTIYDIAAITNGENATNVLGQPNYLRSTAATQQNGLNVPIGLAYDSANNRLFVAQSTGNRVTVYDVSSIVDGQNATNVLGQPNYLRSTAATTQNGVNAPSDLVYDSVANRLFIAQSTGNRVTIYDVTAMTDGENATNFLGQPNYTASTAATQQNGMNTPVSVAYDTTHQKLFVGQSGSNRVTVYDVAGLVNISGTVYTDQGTTTIASGRTVAVSINGAAAAGTTTTASDGTYTVSGLTVTAGDILTIYLDGATEKAVTVTVGSSASLTGVDLYQNRLMTRCDNSSCSVTNANLSTAAGNGDADISEIYSVNSSVLNVKSGKALVIPASHSFRPGNNVNVGSGVTIAGTFLPQGNTVTFSGSWLKTGTFTAATGSVVLNGGSQTLSGSTHFYALTKSVTSASTLTFSAGGTFTVTGALVLQGAAGNLLSLRSSLTGSAWNINPISTRTITYLDVKDGNNANATAIECVIDTCTDSGNNTNWSFLVTAASSSSSSEASVTVSSQTSGGSHGGYGVIMAKKIREAAVSLFARFSKQIIGIIAPEPSKPTTQFVLKEERSLMKAALNINSHPSPLNVAQVSDSRGLLVAKVNEKNVLYKDVPIAAWFAPYVATLIQDGVAQGYKDTAGEPTGEFGVKNPVTYAEALKMALEVSGRKPEGGVPRNESAKNTWAMPYVKTAEMMHLSVYPPDRNIAEPATRGALIQTVLESFGITIGRTPSTFADVPKNHPYSNAIAAAAFFGLIQGDTDAGGVALNTFRPDEPINRAEVAKIIALAKALQ